MRTLADQIAFLAVHARSRAVSAFIVGGAGPALPVLTTTVLAIVRSAGEKPRIVIVIDGVVDDRIVISGRDAKIIDADVAERNAIDAVDSTRTAEIVFCSRPASTVGIAAPRGACGGVAFDALSFLAEQVFDLAVIAVPADRAAHFVVVTRVAQAGAQVAAAVRAREHVAAPDAISVVTIGRVSAARETLHAGDAAMIGSVFRVAYFVFVAAARRARKCVAAHAQTGPAVRFW